MKTAHLSSTERGKISPLQAVAFGLLALVFTVGLTFASVEIPSIIDEGLQSLIRTPGDDSHASPAQVYRTELFISHFHLRLLGYVCFGLTLLLIIIGFAQRKSGMAAVGAVALMLPLFAQFASVMFFLAGLGLLNVFWLPVLDVTFDTAGFGLIIRAPYDLVSWLFRQIGVNAFWPTVYLLIGGGLFVFFLGTFAWLSARWRGTAVADALVYRFSRHPQYLGWLLWTYGLYIFLLQGHYPRRSWGIDASFPWLISAIVIVGVALVEEITMQSRFGASYRAYRDKTPFLVPLPRAISRIFTAPCQLLFKKEWPARMRDVVAVLSVYALVLIGASLLTYGGGIASLHRWAGGEENRQKQMISIAHALKESPHWRERSALAAQLTGFGEAAVPVLVDLLTHENPEIRAEGANRLGELRSEAALDPLVDALDDRDRNVRVRIVGALDRIGAPQSAGPILQLARDPDIFVRRAAGRALANLKEERSLDMLLMQLEDSLVWMRVAAAEDLGTLGLEAGVPYLVEQLHHESSALRRAVVVGLMRIGSAEALDALRKAGNDEDWEVRLYVAEAIKSIEGSALEDR
jgi:protein-S-isoprenylcysteine O-methyltransferase Ste14